MNSFQILSTQFRIDGWMDMNILTPYGLLSIEFQLDNESINALSILDFVQMDPFKRFSNEGQLDNNRLKSLLVLVKILACEDYWKNIEPFGVDEKNNICNKPLNISAN